MSGKALIVVDVQNDFLPGGSLAVPRGDEVIAPINRLMPFFDTVILTADWHPADHVSFAASHPGRKPLEKVGDQVLWPVHCVAGTRGADFGPGLDTAAAAAVIRKGRRSGCDSYSGFIEADRKTPTGLAGLLRELCVTDVWVCGLATDFCVAWTAMDSAAAGFRTRIIEDASRAIDVGGSLAAARTCWQSCGVESVSAASVTG